MALMTNNANKEVDKKKKRIFGCIGWAIVLSASGSILLNIFSLVKNGFSFINWWSLDSFTGPFIVYLLPTVALAVIAGSYTEPGRHFWHSALIVAPFVATVYTLFMYYSYSTGVSIGDVSYYSSRETFWNPASIGVLSIIEGIILGIIASYGYWHAGRKS